MRPYLTTDEARELVAGRVPATVVAKLAAKLDKPTQPIPGQTSIYDHLEDRDGNATRQPEARAT